MDVVDLGVEAAWRDACTFPPHCPLKPPRKEGAGVDCQGIMGTVLHATYIRNEDANLPALFLWAVPVLAWGSRGWGGRILNAFGARTHQYVPRQPILSFPLFVLPTNACAQKHYTRSHTIRPGAPAVPLPQLPELHPGPPGPPLPNSEDPMQHPVHWKLWSHVGALRTIFGLVLVASSRLGFARTVESRPGMHVGIMRSVSRNKCMGFEAHSPEALSVSPSAMRTFRIVAMAVSLAMSPAAVAQSSSLLCIFRLHVHNQFLELDRARARCRAAACRNTIP